jgi:hypothetical protein
LKSSRAIAFFSILTFVGVSLLIGDSVITPAISILSAVEGLHFIPNISGINQATILTITVIITIVLFGAQKNGLCSNNLIKDGSTFDSTICGTRVMYNWHLRCEKYPGNVVQAVTHAAHSFVRPQKIPRKMFSYAAFNAEAPSDTRARTLSEVTPVLVRTVWMTAMASSMFATPDFGPAIGIPWNTECGTSFHAQMQRHMLDSYTKSECW